MAKSREQIDSALRNEFVPLIQSVFEEAFVSLVVYGSFLKPTFAPGVSDVNVLIVVESANSEQLRDLGRRGRSILRRYRITPLVLARREFASSADVFPMEYLDIVDAHEVLVGPDVTAELKLTSENLRHQVEHQLRGNLVSLRQLAAASGRRRPFAKRALRHELEQWYGSLAAILRGLLRLKGVAPVPHDPVELVQRINKAFGFEAGPFLALLRARRKDGPDTIDLIDSLHERLTTLVQIVDELDAGGTP